MEFLKVEVYIPEEYVIKLANELNERDILKEALYDYVFASTSVKGHFRPLEGANPFSGKVGVVNEVPEVKMEFRIKKCHKEDVEKIIDIVHPYEDPVVNFIELL